MVLPNPFQQLRDLDTAQPQFRTQLIDFLHGDEYRNALPNLQGEDLVWLVEYLDSVSYQTISPTLCSTPRRFLSVLPILRASHSRNHWASSEIFAVLKKCYQNRVRFVLSVSRCTQRKTRRKSARCAIDVTSRRSQALTNPQAFHQVVVVWKHLAHPNIVPLLGATIDPPQLISDWMSSGNLMEYITSHPDADRIGLVRIPSTASYDGLTPPPVI